MHTFKIDENLPVEAATLLCRKGYDATTLEAQQLSGSPDSDIAAICKSEGRALLTLDLDFADIRSYPPGNYHGIIVLRLRKQDKPTALKYIHRIAPLLETEPLDRHLWMVDENNVRIR